MHENKKLILIEGVFKNDEAREMLMNIFSAKLTFHQQNNFSSRERFGKDDEIAQKRVPELKKEVVKLKAILAEAEAKNKMVKINSEITISLAEG
jgi:hypothetical protein